MITLTAQADKIANILRQPDNHELKERIKESFKNMVARHIRQSFEKHGIDDNVLLSFEAKLIDVKYPESNFYKEGRSMKRSEYKLPAPIRFGGSAPFVSVSDGARAYTYIHPRELHHNSIILSTGQSGIYIYENGYVYCSNLDETSKLKTQYVYVSSPWEDPEQVLDFYNTESDFQNTVIPVPRDIITAITNELLRSEFGAIPEPEEIKVSLDERPS